MFCGAAFPARRRGRVVHATACKAVYPSSILGAASKPHPVPARHVGTGGCHRACEWPRIGSIWPLSVAGLGNTLSRRAAIDPPRPACFVSAVTFGFVSAYPATGDHSSRRVLADQHKRLTSLFWVNVCGFSFTPSRPAGRDELFLGPTSDLEAPCALHYRTGV